MIYKVYIKPKIRNKVTLAIQNLQTWFYLDTHVRN